MSDTRFPYLLDDTLQEQPIKFIIAMNRPETGPYGSCARVIASNHPRFVANSRFDYGFLGIALDQGYTVTFVGNYVPHLAAKWEGR